MNLGSPTVPSAFAIARYLSEFLSDPKVVTLSRVLWLPLLHLIILPLRSFRNIHKYQSVWINKNIEKNKIKYLPFGSPLHFLSALFLRKIQDKLIIDNKNGAENIQIRLAMRYGQPNLTWAIKELKIQAVEEVLLFPLYPQYSISTTQTVIDKFSDEVKLSSGKINVKTIKSYACEDFYINSLVTQINNHFTEFGKSEKLLFSFHGLPQKMIDDGDPYQNECLQTAQLIREKLKLSDQELIVSFQSRFGKDKWVSPYTEETLINLAKSGIKSVTIICPGFAVDCLETLEEINIELREVFIKNGGTEYYYINCLNENDFWIDRILEFAKKVIRD